MAYTTLTLEHPLTGAVKEAPIGFSWTGCFFGMFPLLFRGNVKLFFILLLLACVTYGLSGFITPFFMNKWHAKGLVGSGYKGVSVDNGNWGLVESTLGMRIPRKES